MYVFNPRGATRATSVQPRPAEVTLEQVTIDAAEPLDETLGRRNQAQLDNLARLPAFTLEPVHRDDTSAALGALFSDELSWAYRCYSVTTTQDSEGRAPVDPAGRRLFQSHLYLFNVIIAFEWLPSGLELATLERALRRAADFLYDVTDGWMTFGQAVIGGPELLDCADIQLFASNRLLPRSWVGGLHEPLKYMPIRLGRGLWQKNRGVSLPWDEPESYRVLVHEWAHYALELLDDYIDTHEVYIPGDVKATQGSHEARRSNLSLAVPSINQPVESIMATLEGTSELTAKRGDNRHKRKADEWETLIYGFAGRHQKRTPRFPRIEKEHQPIEGPLPLRELPHITRLTLGGPAPEAPAELLLTATPPQLRTEHCWVYLLKHVDLAGLPGSILGQGTLDALTADGFRLLGAAVGDELLLIGNDMGWRERVVRAAIAEVGEPDRDGRRRITRLEGAGWSDVTPERFPVVVVQPEPVETFEDRAARLRVSLHWPGAGAPAAGEVELCLYPLDQVVAPLGSAGAAGRPRVEVEPGEPTREKLALDGHVFVKLGDRCMIATYSQGGGPPTGSPVGGTPMTPGSSEGNLMICFADQGEYPDGNESHGEVRVVTTRWPGGAPSGLASQAQARSYAYTLCSNQAIPARYLPTLALFYDRQAELHDGEPLIHRLDDDGTWKPVISYRPAGAWYVAAPLDGATARRLTDPGLPSGQLRVEHYRLYWVPRERA
jgi:hypothetical protein